MHESFIELKAPLFITGVYRSGTTLISKILDSHADLTIVSDTLHFFRFYLDKYNQDGATYKRIVSDTAHRLYDRYKIHVPENDINEYLGRLSEISFRDIYNTIMIQTFCNGDRNARWGEKSLIQWTNIPLFLHLFPKGQAIHMIRAPRDVLASYREMTNESANKYLDAIFACLHSMDWASKVGSTLNNKQYLILKHEDLVTNPSATIHNICNFLNIQYNENMTDFSSFRDQTGNPWESNSAFGDIPNNITAVSVGRWQQHLKSFEIGLTESIIGNLLETFDYEPSNTKLTRQDLQLMWEHIHSTPLIQQRLRDWLHTGEGVESYPSDPTNPTHWQSD